VGCLHCVGRKSVQDNEGGEAVAVGILFTTILILPFGIIGQGFQNITPTFFYLGIALALLSSAIRLH
jgi:inner membrane transporter RhtA